MNVKSEIIKIVEDDRGDCFYNVRMERAFLNMIYVKRRRRKKSPG